MFVAGAGGPRGKPGRRRRRANGWRRCTRFQPDLQDVKVEGGLDTAMQSYQCLLEDAGDVATPEADAAAFVDLKIDKEYGSNGTGELLELPAPQAVTVPARAGAGDEAAAGIGVAAIGLSR